MTDASSTEMTMLVGKKNYNKALSIFQLSWFFLTVISFIAGIAIFLTIYFFINPSSIGIMTISNNQFITIALLFLVYTFISIQISLLSSCYKSVGQFPKLINIMNFFRALEFIGCLLLIFMGVQPIGIVYFYLLIKVIHFIYIKLDVFKISPWYVYAFSNYNYRDFRILIKPSFASGIFACGNFLINQAPILLIGSSLGASSVSVFTAIRTLSRITLRVNGIVMPAVMPELSRAFGSNSKKTIILLNRKLMKYAFWSSTLITIFLLIFSSAIISIWSNNNIEMQKIISSLFVLESYTYLVWYVCSLAVVSKNKHFSITINYLLVKLFAVILIYFSLPHLGLKSVPVIFIGANLIIGYLAISKMLSVTMDSPYDLLVSIFKIKLDFSKGFINAIKNF